MQGMAGCKCVNWRDSFSFQSKFEDWPRLKHGAQLWTHANLYKANEMHKTKQSFQRKRRKKERQRTKTGMKKISNSTIYFPFLKEF